MTLVCNSENRYGNYFANTHTIAKASANPEELFERSKGTVFFLPSDTDSKVHAVLNAWIVENIYEPGDVLLFGGREQSIPINEELKESTIWRYKTLLQYLSHPFDSIDFWDSDNGIMMSCDNRLIPATAFLITRKLMESRCEAEDWAKDMHLLVDTLSLIVKSPKLSKNPILAAAQVWKGLFNTHTRQIAKLEKELRQLPFETYQKEERVGVCHAIIQVLLPLYLKEMGATLTGDGFMVRQSQCGAAIKTNLTANNRVFVSLNKANVLEDSLADLGLYAGNDYYKAVRHLFAGLRGINYVVFEPKDDPALADEIADQLEARRHGLFLAKALRIGHFVAHVFKTIVRWIVYPVVCSAAWVQRKWQYFYFKSLQLSQVYLERESLKKDFFDIMTGLECYLRRASEPDYHLLFSLRQSI